MLQRYEKNLLFRIEKEQSKSAFDCLPSSHLKWLPLLSQISASLTMGTASFRCCLPFWIKKTPQPVSRLRVFMLALPIFPGRRQPSIVTVNELNYCVRNGNRCTLVTINTYYFVAHSCAALLLYHTISLLSTSFLKKFGDPWENRTPVCGVRGRRLSRLTNGP